MANWQLRDATSGSYTSPPQSCTLIDGLTFDFRQYQFYLLTGGGYDVVTLNNLGSDLPAFMDGINDYDALCDLSVHLSLLFQSRSWESVFIAGARLHPSRSRPGDLYGVARARRDPFPKR